MSQLLPSALIIGIDHFVARDLAEKLVDKDIKVVGVGDYVTGLNEISNFEWVMDLSEVEGEFSYVFDFEGKIGDWEKINGEKFVLISVNNKERSELLRRESQNWEANWRIVETYEVYGAGMGEGTFLTEVMRMAVRNKNLELPPLEKKYKLLAVADLVEAILRASFLSGTEREDFLVLGKETDSEEVAKILMDEAKMTRFKVKEMAMEINQGSEIWAEESEKKLRWRAEIDFVKGVRETLQYFFSKMDEENRAKKKISKPLISSSIDGVENINEEKKTERRFDVVVEEEQSWPVKEEEDDGPKLVNYLSKQEEKKEERKEVEQKLESEDYIEEESEEFEDIPRFDLKVNKINKEIGVEVKQEPIKNKKTKRMGWWMALVLTILVLLAMPIQWVLTTVAAINNVKKVENLIKTKKYVKAMELAENNLKKITAIDESVSDWNLNKWKMMRNYQTGLKILEDGLTLEKKAIPLVQSMDVISGAIFDERSIDWNGKLAEVEDGLGDLENNLGILQARLNGDYSWLPSRWKISIQKWLKLSGEVKEQISLGKKMVKILPEFLGVDGQEKKYLVLFQNESEIRPTGGFIGSYGLLTFKGGGLINFEIKDVYEADGQLNGHVEPPWEIKTHLNEANWYMRDANWNVDFTKTAQDIQWFLEKETGQKVNGVIGMDLAVAKAVLGVVGEVYVPDFKEKINKDNLYEQAEFYAETKFFPGSAQKASFLGGLGKQLFEEIKSLKTEKMALLLQSVIDLFEKNELQMALNDKKTAGVINELGWDGKIYNGKCGVDNCVADYLYVNEANLGVNKANYFLNRSIEQVIDISNNVIGRVVKINYENTAKNSNWPGGDYKNYMRIYLPLEVNLAQVSVTDGDNASNKKIYTNDELRIREVGGKKEVGFLVTVPVLKRMVVEVRYSSTVDLANKEKFNYINYIQKQPGSGGTNLVSLIAFPDGWQVGQVQPAASLVGGKLLFNQALDRDIKMGVELGK